MTQGQALEGVKKLKASHRSTKHDHYSVTCDCGTYLGGTKMSRKPASMQLGASLESAMATQLGIQTGLWRDIAGCTKGLREYLTALGHQHGP